MCPCNFTGGERCGVIPGTDVMDVLAGHEGHPRGHTERRIAVGIGEGDTIFSESVHVWGLDERVSVGPAIHRCVFVGHDNEEIGLLFCGHGVPISRKIVNFL